MVMDYRLDFLNATYFIVWLFLAAMFTVGLFVNGGFFYVCTIMFAIANTLPEIAMIVLLWANFRAISKERKQKRLEKHIQKK